MWGRGSINQSKGEVNITQTGNDNAQSICIIQGESFPAEKLKLLAWKSKGLNRNSGPEQQQTPGAINQRCATDVAVPARFPNFTFHAFGRGPVPPALNLLAKVPGQQQEQAQA